MLNITAKPSIKPRKIKYPKVHVSWLDIISYSEWKDAKELAKLEPTQCHNRGYLFSQDKYKTILFASCTFDEEGSIDYFGDITIIPTFNVLKMVKEK